MATPSLAVLHTAALRLREAADRFVVAFERAAAEATTEATAPEADPAPAPRRGGKGGSALAPESLRIIELASRPQGVESGELRTEWGGGSHDHSFRFRDLRQYGKLVRRKAYALPYRYFTTDAAADAWLASVPPDAEPVAPNTRGGRPLGGVSLALVEFVRQAGAAGVAPKDVLVLLEANKVKASNDAAAARLGALADHGSVVRARRPSGWPRYFIDQVSADAWAAKPAPPQLLAAMVEADAPAVAAALAVIAPAACAPQPISLPSARAACAPQPAPSAPPPKPYIPPTPSMARGERREQLAAAAFVAPVAKPTGDTIVPSTAKITVAPTPVDGRYTVDPSTMVQDSESFSAQWARLRGLSA
jgi:hypothetical protein